MQQRTVRVFGSRRRVAISVSAKGKATASVTIFVPWPPPNEHCVYTGKASKDNEVKGENTVTAALTVSERRRRSS